MQQPSVRRSEAISQAQRTREPSAVRPAITRAKKKQTSNVMNDHSVHDPAPRYSAHQQQQHSSMHHEYDILDSLVNHPSHPRPSAKSQQPRLGHRATPLPTTRSTVFASTIAPPPRAAGGYTYADFDSLLQKVHSPHPYTTLSAQPALSSFAGGKQPQASGRMSRHDQPTAAASGSTANPARRIRSKSQGPPTATRPTSASSTRTKRSTNHFLAPTQASLQRIQAQQRARTDDHRRPFI